VGFIVFLNVFFLKTGGFFGLGFLQQLWFLCINIFNCLVVPQVDWKMKYYDISISGAYIYT